MRKRQHPEAAIRHLGCHPGERRLPIGRQRLLLPLVLAPACSRQQLFGSALREQDIFPATRAIPPNTVCIPVAKTSAFASPVATDVPARSTFRLRCGRVGLRESRRCASQRRERAVQRELVDQHGPARGSEPGRLGMRIRGRPVSESGHLQCAARPAVRKTPHALDEVARRRIPSSKNPVHAFTARSSAQCTEHSRLRTCSRSRAPTRKCSPRTSLVTRKSEVAASPDNRRLFGGAADIPELFCGARLELGHTAHEHLRGFGTTVQPSALKAIRMRANARNLTSPEQAAIMRSSRRRVRAVFAIRSSLAVNRRGNHCCGVCGVRRRRVVPLRASVAFDT
jgi:hypothetical protein